MPVIYCIEYKDKIVMLQEGVRFELIKNEYTFKEFQKLKNKYIFVDLLGGRCV